MRSREFYQPGIRTLLPRKTLLQDRDIIAEWINETPMPAQGSGLPCHKELLRSRVASGKEAEGAKYTIL